MTQFTNSPQGVPVIVSSSPIIHQAGVVLNNTQVKALPSGLVEIIGAPGLARTLVLSIAFLRSEFSGGAYGNVGATLLTQLLLGTNRDWSNYLDENQSTFFAGADIRNTTLGPTSYSPSTNLTIGSVVLDGENVPVNLSVFNSDGPFSDGHINNKLLVSCEFRVFDSNLNRFLTVEESGYNQSTRTFN